MIGAAVGLAGSAISAGTSAAASAKMAKAQKEIAEKQIRSQEKIYEAGTAEREVISKQVGAEAGIAREQLRSAEEASLKVFGALGRPGTYGPEEPTTYGGPIGLRLLAPTGLGGIREGGGGPLTGGRYVTEAGRITGEDVKLGKKPRWEGARKWEVEGQVTDPDVLAQSIIDTPGFRTVSKMVAESGQLLNREGPLWTELNNSVVGGIYEGSAALQRQAMEDLSRSMARGGTARRAGLAMAQRFQVQEQINRQRTGALWQSKLALEQWTRDYAQQVQSFAQSWTQNSAGIRDSYTAALTNLRTFWSSTIPSHLIGAQGEAQQVLATNTFNAQQGLIDAARTKISGIASAISGFSKALVSSAPGIVGTAIKG